MSKALRPTFVSAIAGAVFDAQRGFANATKLGIYPKEAGPGYWELGIYNVKVAEYNDNMLRVTWSNGNVAIAETLWSVDGDKLIVLANLMMSFLIAFYNEREKLNNLQKNRDL